MSYRDRDRRRDRDDYRGGGDRYGGRDNYGGGRDSYGGGRDSYGGGRDSYGGGRDSYGGGRNDWDRRSRDGGGGGGGGRRFGGGGGGGGDMRRKGGGSFGGGGGGGGGYGGGGGGRGRSGSFGRGGGGGGGGGKSRDGKRMGGPRNGPPEKRYKNESSNWNDDERHGLMQSIFMETKPENFEEDWVFAVCPPGKRRLLVAASETTQSYNNAGAQDLEFKSCLPSGCDVRGELDKISDITILDTVYSAEKKMFYIVDMLHWKHYPYYDTEADFRFYCLNDKWAQLNSPDQTSENNEYPLHKLEKHECSDAKILEVIKEFDGKVEGLLFIKKKALYKFRESVDCLWLKLDKLEKVLGFEVPEGVSFATSNAKDEKRMQEQEQRKKQYEERVAAREKKEKEKEAAAAGGQKEGDESKQEGEDAEGDDNATEDEEDVPVEEDAPKDNGEADEDQEMTEDGDGN